MLDQLYRAARDRTNAQLAGRLINLRDVTCAPDDHRTVCTLLWAALLADGARALAIAGRWQDAAEHAAAHRGIGTRLDGQYDVLAATLPDLIAEARHAVREMTGDDQVAAHGLLATCCQIAAGVTVMVGAEDLAWTAVERSLAAAEQSGDQLCCASAAQFASWIYRRQGRYDECQQIATRAAERYEPRMSTAEPAQLSIWGGLLVEASSAAARANRPTDADDLLAAVAAAAAARLGEDRWDRWCERAGSRRSALLDRMVEHLKLVPAA